MPQSFSIQRSEEENFVILALEGFLDAHTAPDFEAAVQREIDDGNLRLVVDATDLTYISSAGLGVFMGFVEEIREQGGDLKICNLRSSVREVFDLLGFDALFDLVESRSAAFAKFAEGTPKGGEA